MTHHVYKAINDVQRDLAETGISKDRTNSQGAGYKFRGIDDVYNAIAPLLAKHGLCIIPRFVSRQCEERVSAAGKALFYVTLEAEFDFVSAEDGSKHTARTFGEAMDSGDKATNKAMSAAFKYAAFQTFTIPIDGAQDGDQDTHEVIRIDRTLVMKCANNIKAHIQAGRDMGVLEEVESAQDMGTDFAAAVWHSISTEEQNVCRRIRGEAAKKAKATTPPAQ